MRSSRLVFVAASLLVMLLAGCVSQGYAGQAEGSMTPPLNVVDPKEQSNASKAAGETPSVLGSTPEAGQVGAWERHRFFDVWDIGYPDGWQVNRPGNGEVVLSGAYGEHEYKVELDRPSGVQAKVLADWVQTDLAKIDQTGAPRAEVTVKGMPALKVTNLKLPGQNEGSCPAVRTYARTDKLQGEQNYLIMTITQADQSACDQANIERLADALIAEVRS